MKNKEKWKIRKKSAIGKNDKNEIMKRILGNERKKKYRNDCYGEVIIYKKTKNWKKKSKWMEIDNLCVFRIFERFCKK